MARGAVGWPGRKEAEQAAISAIRKQTIFAYKQIRRTWYAHIKSDMEAWPVLRAGLISRPETSNIVLNAMLGVYKSGPHFIDSPDQWIKLVHKLRWIGLTKDAELLQKALVMLASTGADNRRSFK